MPNKVFEDDTFEVIEETAFRAIKVKSKCDGITIVIMQSQIGLTVTSGCQMGVDIMNGSPTIVFTKKPG